MASIKIGKLREPEARWLALLIAAKCPGHKASTALIKERVPDYRGFSPEDLNPSKTRSGECMWQQIVGNVVSHEKNSTSLFNRGLAVRTSNGIRVTDKGLEALKAKGLL